ncbi:hypothetical protein [Mangrovihabitans endophyticus]|uniref:Transglutaminase-like superfamily protein n=1 Tax=Mangrovihabitans endophyticus TaxID=1751298 RepID=A0A8J3FLY5_9ACTN|nr:hypothetical protein [Mangrovihabitans endophyticus]GGK75449.1 hypothetical protein GCM10012284_06800 [Mangrovihabitans endophyticus]
MTAPDPVTGRLRPGRRLEPAGVVLPPMWGSVGDTVLSLIEWVHTHVRKVEADAAWLRTRYLRRSVLEILAEGTTFCLGPCPERTLVASAALSLYGVRHRIVLHERHVHGTGPPLVHMAIEVETEYGLHHVDFSMWETKYFRGEYRFRADIERTIGLTRIQLPAAHLLLGATPDALATLVPRRESERDAKVEWYLGDLGHIDPRLLDEHLIFTDAASRYERRHIAPR